jgi:hypothetical protein
VIEQRQNALDETLPRWNVETFYLYAELVAGRFEGAAQRCNVGG